MSGEARRVAVLAVDYPPSTGGIQAYLRGFIALIDAQVRVFAAGAETPEDAANVTRLGFADTGPLARALLNLRMASRAARFRPHVVVAGHVLALPAALAVRRIARSTIVAIAYGGELRAPRSRALTRRLLRRADGVAAISDFTASELASLGVRTDRISVIPPAVDPVVDAPRTVLRAAADRPYLLLLGRMDDLHKGHDVAIEAMSVLAPRHPDLTLVLAGDGRERDRLELLARCRGVTQRVTLAGRVPESQKQALIAGATALLLPSRIDERGRFEGFGIVVLEAALHGVPAIVGSAGGLPDAVEHGRTGLVVDATDVDAVVAAVERVLDESYARALGEAARERALSQFTWESRRGDVRALLAGSPESAT